MAARSLRWFALGWSAFATLIGTAGCVEDGVSLHAICPIMPTIEDDACEFDAAGEACVAEGVLNLASASNYRFTLRVESGLRARARVAPPQGEPNGIQLRSAEVDLRLPTGERLGLPGGLSNPYEVSASGYVAPGALSFIAVTAIDPARLQALRTSPQNPSPLIPQIVVAVKVKGVTNGGQDVTGGEFVWPVRLISKSSVPGSGQCQVRPYCSGSLGQDMFAEACEASSSAE